MLWKENDEILIIPAGELGVGHTCFIYTSGYTSGDYAVVVDCGMNPQVSWSPTDPPPRLDILDDLLARGVKVIGVITHAHLDHIGAVRELVMRKIPVYFSEWTGRFMEVYVEDLDIPKGAETHVFEGNQVLTHGDFQIYLISVYHSIPGTRAILLRRGNKVVLHLGDFKLNGMQEGIAKTRKVFQDIRLSVGQVNCLVMDVLNTEMDGFTPPEQPVFDSIEDIIKEASGQIIITCFASNIRRIEAIIKKAVDHHKTVGIGGFRMSSSCRLLGKGSLPRNGDIVLIGGSQGEEGSGLVRLSRDEHKHLSLSRGSTVVVSSRCIPGNEENVKWLLEDLHAHDVKIILHENESKKLDLSFRPEERFLHVSGHEQRGGLQETIEILKPEMIIPFHAPEDRRIMFEQLVGGKQTKHLQRGETLNI
ncbi:MAG: ribonuclease J [Patescibacteria group bacterium]